HPKTPRRCFRIRLSAGPWCLILAVPKYGVALAVLLMVPVAAGQVRMIAPPPPPPPVGINSALTVVGNGVLLGQVVDGQSGGAIPGAIVSLQGGVPNLAGGRGAP